MPDGTMPEPGGWNRFSLEVPDLAATVDALRTAGVHFRNDIVTSLRDSSLICWLGSNGRFEALSCDFMSPVLLLSGLGAHPAGAVTVGGRA